MLRKSVQRFALLLCLLIFFTQTAYAKEYQAERFDSILTIQSDGSLLVTETVTFHFSNDSFSFVKREVPDDKTDGITFIEAKMDGKTLPQGENAGQVEVSDDGNLEIEWHFPETSNSTHTFDLTYKVVGVVQQTASGDVLNWEALPNDYEYAIRSSTITVNYPTFTKLVGQSRLKERTATITEEPNSIVFKAQNLTPGTQIEPQLTFQAGSLVRSTPLWQQREAKAGTFLPYALAAGIGAFFIGLLGIFTYKNQQKQRPAHINLPQQTHYIPDGISPAEFGLLTNAAANGKADENQFLATLFDLANRNSLFFVETTSEKLKPKKQDHEYILQRQEHQEWLRPYEQGLLDILFVGNTDYVNVNELSSRYKAKKQLFNAPLLQALREQGLINDTHTSSKRLVDIIAWITLALSLIIGVLALILNYALGTWPFLLSAAGFLGIGIMAFIASYSWPFLTARGEQLASQCRATEYYLVNILNEKEQLPSTEEAFLKWLPYAISTNKGKGWIEHFQKKGVTTSIFWFQPITDKQDDVAPLLSLMNAVNLTNHYGAYQGGGSAWYGNSSAFSDGGGFGGGDAGGGSSSAG